MQIRFWCLLMIALFVYYVCLDMIWLYSYRMTIIAYDDWSSYMFY